MSVFSHRDTFGQDLTELFNLLTGYTRPQKFHHLLLAPMGLREDFLAQIRREADHARTGPTGARHACSFAGMEMSLHIGQKFPT